MSRKTPLMFVLVIVIGLFSMVAFGKSRAAVENAVRVDEANANEAISMANLRVRAWTEDQIQIEAEQRIQRRKAQGDQSVREKVFENQLIYTPLIFSIVAIMVISGVVFSGLQCWRDFRHGGAIATSLKITRNGIEMSSSVIGVLTLVVSFCFFYVYIVEIYKITDVSLRVISGESGSRHMPRSVKENTPQK